MTASRRMKLGAPAVALVVVLGAAGAAGAEVREETLKLAGVLCSG